MNHIKIISQNRLRWIALAVLVILHFGIQEITRMLLFFMYITNDPILLEHGSWLHYINHHVVQMLIATVLIALLTRGHFKKAGFNLQNMRESLNLLTKGFFPVLLIFLLAGHAIVPLIQATPPERFTGDLRLLDFSGMMIFSWIIVGLSEETVFRGFFQSALAKFWNGTFRLFDTDIPIAGFIAALIFTIAHISFRNMSADPRQLILAFVLGLYYAVAYYRTGSLLAPIIAHNLVDGGIITVEWIVSELAF